MQKLNLAIIVLAMIASLALCLYAAQPWGDNYMYQDISGYISLMLFNIWVATPFLVMYVVNWVYGKKRAGGIIILAGTLIGGMGAVAFYIQATLITISSTSGLIFIFMPLYQVLFIAIVAIICMVIYR